MERIVINGLMYTCKNGTNEKISVLLRQAEKAPRLSHENGTAYDDFNEYLWSIEESKKGVFIENVYRT